MKITLSTQVPLDHRTVFKRFDQELLKRLTPFFITLDLKRFEGSVLGSSIHLEARLFGIISQYWENKVTAFYSGEDENYFVDEGIVMPFPLKFWQHKHRIKNIGNKNSEIIDEIEFKCSNKLIEWLMYPGLWLAFWLRKPIYRKEFRAF